MLFKSAVDWWYYLLIIVIAIVLLVIMGPAIRSGQLSILPALGILLLPLGLPIWLLFSTDYRVSGETLHIRTGPFSWKIPLAEIHSVEPSRSPLSSPALSLDRIEIHYGKSKQILISPADREGFLEAIGQSNSGT